MSPLPRGREGSGDSAEHAHRAKQPSGGSSKHLVRRNSLEVLGTPHCIDMYIISVLWEQLFVCRDGWREEAPMRCLRGGGRTLITLIIASL